MKIPLPFRRIHGTLRGLDGVAHAKGRSSQSEGRFGRMFRTLPPATLSDGDVTKTENDLKALAAKMIAASETEAELTKESASQPDNEENVGPDPTQPTISAGYTYLGQFIDHDLTFDPSSSLQKQDDPDALTDFRTPRFDLDNIYGRGPDDQPYLYQPDGVRMLLGRELTGNSNDPKARDVPRNNPGDGSPKRALIGDPRNDENVIVSQLQATMLRFHNRMADVLNATAPEDFVKVQEAVRWHYQWVVLNDFLPTIIGPEMLNAILPHLKSKKSVLDDPPMLRFYKPKLESFIPVEFSVAAYRFGHSMVRPIYRLNEVTPPQEDGPRLPIFSVDGTPSLVGFHEFPSTWAVDWRLFFNLGPAPKAGKTRIQPAYKIDTSLVNPLGNLPTPVTGPTPFPSLAERNLLRGLRMGLPSGQAVARAMGVPVIPDELLRIGKATEENKDGGTLPNLVFVDQFPAFRDNAPLWYYILAESQQAFAKDNTPIRLGPVGGRIIGEVFVGLLWYDSHSFLRQDPNWKPLPQFMKGGKFGIAELIAQAMQV
jgi:hypothetical protein